MTIDKKLALRSTAQLNNVPVEQPLVLRLKEQVISGHLPLTNG